MVNDARAATDSQVLDYCLALDEREKKTIVVGEKWRTCLRAAIEDELQRLTARIERVVDRSA